MRTRFLIPLAALLLLGAGCSGGSDGGLNGRDNEAPPSGVVGSSPTDEPVAEQPRPCTQEAKLCPDGSAVGRTGPNCEFAACPTPAPTPEPAPVVAPTPKKSAVAALAVNMVSANFSFAPKTISAKPGQKVDITFTSNEGFHTIVIDAINFKQTVTSGQTVSFVAPTTPGSYPYYCDIGTHRMKGMEGTLIVK